MERVIMAPDRSLDDADGAYLDTILEQIFDAPAAAVTTESDQHGETRCEVSVRPFNDPKAMRVRWALVISSDEFELRDYASKREAMSAYREFLQMCEASGIVWDAPADPAPTAHTEPEPAEAPALTPEQLTALIEAEVSYQVARAELAAAEQRRYAAVWSAYQAVNRDALALLSQVPTTINRATLAGAVRRHAPAAQWDQPELFTIEA